VVNNESKGSHMTKKVVHCFLASTLIVLILVPVWAADKSKDEETLRMPPRYCRQCLAATTFPQTSWHGPIASLFFPM
jgi:hypothetical protein